VALRAPNHVFFRHHDGDEAVRFSDVFDLLCDSEGDPHFGQSNRMSSCAITSAFDVACM
jgi:hypothetical protein